MGTVSPLQILAIVGLLSLQIVLASGLSLLFASLSVYLRDIIQILNIVFQILFYVSPILYPIASVPEGFRPLSSQPFYDTYRGISQCHPLWEISGTEQHFLFIRVHDRCSVYRNLYVQKVKGWVCRCIVEKIFLSIAIKETFFNQIKDRVFQIG